jgi:chromosomal replication initiation ATPase DnaA
MDKVYEIIEELKVECLKHNKKCIVILKNIGDGDKHFFTIDFIVKRICKIYNVSIFDITSWRKSNDSKEAKKMIVFLLINRLSTPISKVAEYLSVSPQSISYMVSHPNKVYSIKNYELFVRKIEKELKEALNLSS